MESPSDAVAGKVVGFKLLLTTLRTPASEYIHVPNNIFSQKIFKPGLAPKRLISATNYDRRNPPTKMASSLATLGQGQTA